MPHRYHGGPHGDLHRARAHWVAPDLVAWDAPVGPDAVHALWADPDGGLRLGGSAVQPSPRSRAWGLAHEPAGLPPALRDRFPHLAHLHALRLPPEAVSAAPELLRGQLAIAATHGDHRLDATALQLAGVLDALYANELPLGPSFAGDRATLRVWAPTARAVALHLFADGRAEAPAAVVPMRWEPASGTWAHEASRAALEGRYYLYEVEVWTRATGRVERNLVTDPYAVALSTNSRRSQAVDLGDPALAPPGWASLAKPPLAAATDMSLYELHVRDFSAHDEGVPERLRGTFLAFASEGSAGLRHLAQLARCGLTHLHLLPTADFATVDDDRSAWRSPPFEELAALPPDSEEQQRRVMATADADGFNWGYDPYHYTVPEGSYASDPEGAARTLEFRRMVQAVNGAGLRLVIDVVYNHAYAAGQSGQAVLDRVVPGYYHRLDGEGHTLSESCCPDTASEHAMMERLIVDSVLTWARQYRVDGFRFDIMGLHMKRTMLRVRAALDALTPERDGVDGRAICLYGEGWNFGAVQDGRRGPNATQDNLAGSGIATFSDRMRDAVRGGGHMHPRPEQGFATGLHVEPNGTFHGSPGEERWKLLQLADAIRLGLAGTLADVELVDRTGARVRGRDLDYHGRPGAGYALRPDDVVNYIGCHDDTTWFDTVSVKAPRALPVAERVRMHNLGLAIVLLSQGIPFVQAGDDLLRSKSGDRNSYSSGDWFNRLDFTGRTHNWGIGLPPARDNGPDWHLLRPLLADPHLRPGPELVAAAARHFQEMLRVRYSTRLFRLRTAEQVREAVTFHNVGPEQVAGLVVLRLASPHVGPGEATQAAIVINARPDAQAWADEAFRGAPLALHPVLRDSHDPLVRTAAFDPAAGRFTVPARTVAVFVG